MKIAIMAAGGVGGYFGARLAAAGHDVGFFARGAHAEAMKRDGLHVESTQGAVHVAKPRVVDDASQLGTVDVVLFAVKQWDTESAGAALRPIVAATTRVISLLNGVDTVDRLATVLDPETLVGGTAFMTSVIERPGVIRHSSGFARLRCGRLDGRCDERVSAFVAAAVAAGIDALESPAMRRELWEKFIFLVALSSSTAMTRMPIGAVLGDPDTRAFARALVDETSQVARASGVDLPAGCADERFAALEKVPPGTKASMLYDLERGNRIELDWLGGHVVQLGRKHGLATPANSAAYTALKLHRSGSHLHD